MKKYALKFIAFILVFIALSSFKKNDIKNHKIDYNLVNQYKIDKLLDIKKSDDQKLAYKLLNIENRFSIWNDKLEKLINENEIGNDKVNLTLDQKKLLIEAHNVINSDIFSNENRNDKRAHFRVLFIRDFLNRAKKSFTNSQFGAVFYSLSIPENHGFPKVADVTLADLMKINVANAEECECAFGYFFDNDCDDDGDCNDYSTNCDGGNWCGFWYAFECDAMCTYN